jgi:hypothetical protein
VPIWSLVGPLLSFAELWRSAHPAASASPDRLAPHPARNPARHGCWWGLWLGALLLSALSVVQLSRSPTLGTMLTHQLSQVVVNGALVGAGLLLLRILTHTTAGQEARRAERTAAPSR